MQTVFTTNDAEISRLAGLYVKERNPPASVRGVSLNAVGIAGVCVRGPVNEVIEITSAARFLEIFGGRDLGSGGAVVGSIWKTLANKPFGKLYICRVAASDAVKASFTLETLAGGAGANIARIDAANVGTWGSNVQFAVTAASSGVATQWDLVIKYLGTTKRYKNLDTSVGVDNTLTVVGDDKGNLITITKLGDGRPVTNANTVDGAVADSSGIPYTNLGQTVTSFVSVSGSNGTLAATDYTNTGKALELLNGYAGVGVCFVADPSTSHYTAIKAKILTIVATANDRIWLVGANDETVAKGAAITDAALYRSDRIMYCFNHVYTTDFSTATTMTTRPEGWVASILSQTDVDIHPGEEDAKQYLRGASALYNESYTREDYISLKEGGISAFEKDNGFALVEAVSTKLPTGDGTEQITRRRMADYLILGMAGFLKNSVKKKNLASRRAANAGTISAWLRDLASSERIVDTNPTTRQAQFKVDTEVLNTPAARAAGIERIFVQVKLVGHILSMVLEVEIGTGVVVQVS